MNSSSCSTHNWLKKLLFFQRSLYNGTTWVIKFMFLLAMTFCNVSISKRGNRLISLVLKPWVVNYLRKKKTMIYLSQIRCFQVRCISLHRVHTAIQMMLSVFSTFAFILRRQKRGSYHLSFSTEFSSRFHIINIAESNMKIIWLFIRPSKKSSYQMLANKSGNIITPAWYPLVRRLSILISSWTETVEWLKKRNT